MPDSRNLKQDLFALALAALTVLIGAALVSYDRADPPSTLVYPANERPNNACGPLGAWAAHGLFCAFGLGAYYLLVFGAVVCVALLRRRPPEDLLLRLIGFGLSLAGLCTLAAFVLPGLSPGPIVGPGGYLGAACRAALEMHVARVGAYVLTLCVLLGGLLLSTDDLLLRLIRSMCRGAGLMLGMVVRRGKAAPTEPTAGHRGRKRTDVEDIEDEEEDFDEDAEQDADDSLDEAEEDEEEEDEELPVRVVGSPPQKAEAAAAGGGGSRAKKLMSALRIKNHGPSSREALFDQLADADRPEDDVVYELPPIDLLAEAEPFSVADHEREIRHRARLLEKAFRNFGFNVKVVEVQTGPVIAQYEVKLEAGLRLSKITSLADDLAIALRVPTVRIVAPIPGKNTVGIEVPNTNRHLVRLREVIEAANGRVKKMRIPLYLGKDVAGNPLAVDLSTLPHLLIAGRTGTGKSVCLNTIIMSMVMSRTPDEVRLLLIDPKMVELTPYARLPHLMHPVVTDMKKAEAILDWAVNKMEERYALLARAGVRHVSVYNQLGEEELMERLRPETDEERRSIPTQLPYIVIVADEMADLMMTAPKEVEAHIIRLAQKSRAVGIHLVLATQKPTVDVITGLIKSNLPARISFQVASKTDSRVVLDEMGADKLLGNGDMLFLWPGTSTLLRGQGAYVSDEEINSVVEFVGRNKPQFVPELVQLKPSSAGGEPGLNRKRDELYEAAIDIVVREGRGSVSLLQRSLGIGYGRAARLIDFMAEDGIVGEYNGSQARDVLITPEQWEDMQASLTAQRGIVAPPPTAATVLPQPPTNRIQIQPSRGGKRLADEEPDDALDDELDEDSQEYAADDQEELFDEQDDEQDEDQEYDEEEEEYDEEDEYEDEYEEDEDDEDADEEYDDEEDSSDDEDLDEEDLDEEDLDEEDLDEEDLDDEQPDDEAEEDAAHSARRIVEHRRRQLRRRRA